MISFSLTPSRLALTTTLLAALALSACATKPDRRGPPSDDRRSGQNARSSGTFLHPVAALFVSMDADNDKSTSREELTQGIQSEWFAFDGNPSAVYFTPWVIENMGSMDAAPNFMSFDRDFNGVVTEDEFSEGLNREFNRLDKDRNDRLVRSEMIVAFTAPQGRASRSGSGEECPERGERGGRGDGQSGGHQ